MNRTISRRRSRLGVGFAPQAAVGLVWTGDAVAVGLAGPDPGDEPVPDPAIAFSQRDLRLRALGIEQAQQHTISSRRHREVRAPGGRGRAERELGAGQDRPHGRLPRSVSLWIMPAMDSIAQRRRRTLTMRSSSQLRSCHALAARDRYCTVAIADALGNPAC